MAHIEVYFSDGRIEHFDLHKSIVTIGRSAEMNIQIDEPVLSRAHARIEQSAKGRWTITDLGSRNKTCLQDKPIRSHVLTDGDALRLGSVKVIFHDPSGKSSEKIARTIYLTGKTRSKSKGRRCPVCTMPAAQDVILCVGCGYDFQTGRQLEVNVDDTAHGSTIMPTTQSAAKRSKPRAAVRQDPAASPSLKTVSSPLSWYIEMTREWILPVMLILVCITTMLTRMSVMEGLISTVGIVISVVFLLLAMAIAAKLGEFAFGHFGTAILKVFGICACMVVVDELFGPWAGLIGFAVLAALLWALFYLDAFELLLIVIISGILRWLLLSIMLAALSSSFSGTANTP